MTDREKVVQKLEEVIAEAVYPDRPRKFMMPLKLAEDAIALLKAQETCEDVVNRKDVINVIKSPCDMRYINGNWQPCIGDYIEAINNLPAAAPKAQEPVKPLKMAVDHVRKEPVVFSYECPVCMCGLQRHWVACPICGTGVKWE